MRAAVLRAYNQPLTIEDIQIDDPDPRGVRTRTAPWRAACATAICGPEFVVNPFVLEMALVLPTLSSTRAVVSSRKQIRSPGGAP